MKLTADRLALISFKLAIKQDPFQIFSSWNNSLHFCQWYGVSCSRRHPHRVAALNLRSQGLVGSLSPHIGNLSFLRLIDLENNSFHGEIPQQIGNLRRAEVIYFSNNSFQENNLIGQIPSGLFNVSNLEIFEVNDNQLNGSIPSDIGLTLPKLRSLAVAANRFTGLVPISLSNASALEQISFEYNWFSGLVPKDFGKLPFLQFVNFAWNYLEDDLSFIDSLTNCSSLHLVGFRQNFLKGTVPISIANLSKELYFLSVADNQLHNVIPLGIENLINLRFFLFGGNYFSGPLLIDFGKFQQLEMLDLGSNKFTGTIPSSIGNLSLLSRVFLGFNNLHGSIPPSLGNCRHLIELELVHNNLTGSIPKQVIGIPSLSISLDLSANSLSGSIPSEVGLLQNLVRLDLSDNKLSGIIPNTIGKCSGLEQLHLEGNSFWGEIPEVMGALQGLKELDISRNNFSGSISNSLMKLDGLKLLNLSFNQLQGEVPKRGIFLNASAVSLQGNNGLCGGITELKLPFCLPPNSKNKVSFVVKVIIPLVVGVFLAFLICLLIIWYCKRNPRKMTLSIPSFQYQFLRISYAELFKATNGFSVENIIGVGSYGSVYKGFLEQIGIEVAIKVLNLQRRGASNSFLSECQALRNVRHRNLLKLLSACSSIDFEGNDFKALIYKFMANGSLEKWLHEDNVEGREIRYLKLIDRLNIAIDIATAIEYLHNGSSSTIIHGETIIHGDLKPSNVLLDEAMTAYIGDFGLAKIISTISDEVQPYQSSSSTAIKGSIGYVAPDYGMGGRISIKGDVYSFGILLLEMFTGKRPTDDTFQDDLNLRIFVERSLSYRAMEIVDPRILSEEGRGSFEKDIIISILKIGVACSMEQPGERIEMQSAISELQKIKGNYLKRKLKQ
ncbi:probable LRR receptor-like serine/threonine-protein kinase At3g47570, partial [Jatropha curcas]|uniref:probable LRR receptor-like serine/threonine-protein kinase At3g47570 n=1 Tax=Jatropha curcas TaxID=180498 RepID=UPI001893A747